MPCYSATCHPVLLMVCFRPVPQSGLACFNSYYWIALEQNDGRRAIGWIRYRGWRRGDAECRRERERDVGEERNTERHGPYYFESSIGSCVQSASINAADNVEDNIDDVLKKKTSTTSRSCPDIDRWSMPNQNRPSLASNLAREYWGTIHVDSRLAETQMVILRE